MILDKSIQFLFATAFRIFAKVPKVGIFIHKNQVPLPWHVGQRGVRHPVAHGQPRKVWGLRKACGRMAHANEVDDH